MVLYTQISCYNQLFFSTLFPDESSQHYTWARRRNWSRQTLEISDPISSIPFIICEEVRIVQGNHSVLSLSRGCGLDSRVCRFCQRYDIISRRVTRSPGMDWRISTTGARCDFAGVILVIQFGAGDSLITHVQRIGRGVRSKDTRSWQFHCRLRFDCCCIVIELHA